MNFNPNTLAQHLCNIVNSLEDDIENMPATIAMVAAADALAEFDSIMLENRHKRENQITALREQQKELELELGEAKKAMAVMQAKPKRIDQDHIQQIIKNLELVNDKNIGHFSPVEIFFMGFRAAELAHNIRPDESKSNGFNTRDTHCL